LTHKGLQDDNRNGKEGNAVYDNSPGEWARVEKDEAQALRKRSWLMMDTLDAWRHAEMLRPLIGISQKESSWLTIGDGRYGSDARLLKTYYKDVCASDYWVELLSRVQEYGIDLRWKRINAEMIEEADKSYDYVLAKECLHHLPRPYMAIYEMLRVSRKGVAIIEPCDSVQYWKEIVKFILGRVSSLDGYWFEPVGNFGYSFTIRDFEKIQLGLGRQYIASRHIGDFYHQAFEEMQCIGRTRAERLTSLVVRTYIKIINLLTQLKLMKPRLVMTLLLKEVPTSEEICELRRNGWKVKRLPINPYNR